MFSAAFVPAVSSVGKWIKNPSQRARPLNQQNHLIDEVLFLIHDYLHSWAYLAINELAPRLGFGTRLIDQNNFEDFVFCHLLTEAVATVGLDYWYLCNTNLNEVCRLGTDIATLTVNYREIWSNEYKIFNRRFNVQKPRFFESLTKFYCSGNFYGFSAEAYTHSALIQKWLDAEITYGQSQRIYTRQWIHHLRAKDFELETHRLGAPVVISKKWQRDLIYELSELLWEKVKEDKLHRFSFKFKKGHTWRADPNAKYDLRFVNLNSIDTDRCYAQIMASPHLEQNFNYFFYQYVSQYDLGTFDRQLIKLFSFLREKRDFNLIKHLFRKEKKIKTFGSEPKDLFFLN